MYTPKTHFSDIDDINNYIEFCEASFKSEINGAVERILNYDKIKMIYICGPSCSGKTTATKLLIKNLLKHGLRVIDISVDDFYLNRSVIIENCKKRKVPIDFESSHSLDIEFLERVLTDIADNAETVSVPVFDFKEGKRISTKNISLTENTIILLEGIQTLYPEIISMYKGIPFKGVGIGLYNDVTLPCHVVSKNDIRLLRRIVRDTQFRNVPTIENFELWQSVRDNEKKNIEPYINSTDIKINSFIGYELSCMKDRALRLLSEITPDSEYYDKALYFNDFLRDIDEIPEKMIPSDSLLKEFLL